MQYMDEEYRERVADLVLALVKKHQGITVAAIYEMVNQLIVQHGLRDAIRFVK